MKVLVVQVCLRAAARSFRLVAPATVSSGAVLLAAGECMPQQPVGRRCVVENWSEGSSVKKWLSALDPVRAECW